MKRHVQRSHDDNDGAAHQSIESATVSPMPNEMCESPTRKLPWPVSLHSGASKAAQTTLPAMGNEIFSNGSCDQIIGQDSSMQFYYTLLGPTKAIAGDFYRLGGHSLLILGTKKIEIYP
jgi:hypothetical protein